MRKTKTMKEIEKRFKADIRDLIIEYYYEKDLRLREVGEILGVNYATIAGWLIRLDLPPKKYTVSEMPEKTSATR